MNNKIVIFGASGFIGGGLSNFFSNRYDLIRISRKQLSSISAVTDIEVRDYSYDSLCSLVESIKFNGSERIVVINAIGSYYNSLIHSHPIDEWEDVIRTNLTVPFFISNVFIKKMMGSSHGGMFINFSSVNKGEGVSSYSSSKAALTSLSESISREYSRFNISSIVVNLGPIAGGGMFESLSPVARKRLLKNIALGRPGDLYQLSRLVDHLITQDWITGSSINFDGGYSL